MAFSWFRRKPTAIPPSAPAAAQPEVDSGCTGVCEMDMASQLCKGCMRTIGEIGNWRHMSAEQKAAVVAEANARKGAAE
ncbi:MAG: DUF1289 domain-containing protein [Planctomycetota bacterium]|mgnify:FL=1|jgi:predicted Fe-S protein YdhL (DUF1289 family)|nr:DUF1289 domain-containing protein [Planctomycetota bacterium]MDG2142460.1 DUF1289 domain-containing protein [Planctomycetota bacterium]